MPEVPDAARRRFSAQVSADVGEIYIYDDIGQSMWGGGISAQEVVDAIQRCVSEGAKSLMVYVNSVGGDPFDGMSMHAAIRRFSGRKTVCIDGLAASAASLVCMAGDEIQMGPGAMMMIHNPSAGGSGNAEDLRQTADRLDKIRDAMIAIYADRTKIGGAKIRTMMADETWMTAADCVKLGFADTVLSRSDTQEEVTMRFAAAMTPWLDRYKNVPENLRVLYAARKSPQSAVPPHAASARQPIAAVPAAKGTNNHREHRMENHDIDSIRAAHSVASDSFKTTISDLTASGAALRSELATARTELATAAALTKAKEEQIASLNTQISALRTEAKDLADFAGKTTLSDARGVFAAWKAEMEAGKDLRAKVAKMETDAKAASLKAMVDQGVTEGKISPAEVEAFMKADPSFVETILKVRPKQVTSTSTQQPPPQVVAPTIPLKPEEIELLKAAGMDPAKLAAQIASGQTPSAS